MGLLKKTKRAHRRLVNWNRRYVANMKDSLAYTVTLVNGERVTKFGYEWKKEFVIPSKF